MNIQTIIDKLSEEFNLNEIGEKKLKDSLTSLLDSLEKELPKENDYTDGGNSYGVGYNNCRQQVINIINSHR